MKKYSAFTLLISFLLAGTHSSAIAGDMEDRISKASIYVNARDYRRAIHEYEEILKISPDSGKTHLLLGLVYAEIGDLDKAVQYTEKALELDPSYSAYNNLALVYANKADFEKAIDNYEKAMAINPSAYTPWYHMGLIYSSKKEFAKALEYYKKATELNTRFAEGYIGLGSSYYYTGNKAAAWEQVEKLKSLKLTTQSDGLKEWIQNKERQGSSATTVPSSTPSERSAQD